MGATNPSIAGVTSAGNALMGFGEDLSSMFRNTFPGIFSSLVSQSRVDPERYAAEAGADVQDSFEGAKGQVERTATRMGVNPNSGRFAALEQNWGRAMAAAKSGAMTDARFKANDVKFARTREAAGIGLNLGQMTTGTFSNAAGAYGTAGALTNSLNGQNFDIQMEDANTGAYREETRRLNTQPKTNVIS